MTSARSSRAARNRWLPEGRRGPMPWIIGIMMFLTVLSINLLGDVLAQRFNSREAIG